MLVVVGSALLVGHLTALAPRGLAAGWTSAAAFTSLVFAYATLTKAGSRSGAFAFAMGALATGAAWFVWFLIVISLDDSNWYLSTFGGFQIGLSDRGWGHAGQIWLVVWVASLLLMISLALAARRLMLAILRRD